MFFAYEYFAEHLTDIHVILNIFFLAYLFSDEQVHFFLKNIMLTKVCNLCVLLRDIVQYIDCAKHNI